MDDNRRKQWEEILNIDFIPASEIPEMEMYMDQLTTFMESQLGNMKRYPQDKIMTKTMINNYTKNHLIPVSSKKKYSKEHLYLIIMIYYMKNMLSISDIQSLLFPLGTEYYPKEEQSGLTIEDIYKAITKNTDASLDDIKKDIFKSLDDTKGLFDSWNLKEDQSGYLEDFALIFRLSFEIILRKKMIEHIIDVRNEDKK